MRIITLSLLIVFNIGTLYSQPVYRAVEGGRVEVNIDTITPLEDLVSRLELDWKFAQTGKSYWIGYTDDMYSIAQHGNDAIPYLSQLAKESNSIHTRKGAIYTLHLIGIRCNIKGRFIEEFVDTNARIEILHYLNDPELHKTVVELLMRDPWTIDIPYFMRYLETPNVEYSYVLSALKRYEFENKPLGQKLPDTLLSKEIRVRTTDSSGYSLENMILSLKESMPNSVIIANSILNSEEFSRVNTLDEQMPLQYGKLVIHLIFYALQGGSLYCTFDSKYFYSFDEKTIHIMGPNEARAIWLKWWESLNLNGS